MIKTLSSEQWSVSTRKNGSSAKIKYVGKKINHAGEDGSNASAEKLDIRTLYWWLNFIYGVIGILMVAVL